MTTASNNTDLAALLNEAADVLAQNNWRGDLQEALREQAALVPRASKLSSNKNPFDMTSPKLWRLIDAYARAAINVKFWEGGVLNSSLLTPAYDALYALQDELVWMDGIPHTFHFTVGQPSSPGRVIHGLVIEYAKAAAEVERTTGTLKLSQSMDSLAAARATLTAAIVGIAKPQQQVPAAPSASQADQYSGMGL